MSPQRSPRISLRWTAWAGTRPASGPLWASTTRSRPGLAVPSTGSERPANLAQLVATAILQVHVWSRPASPFMTLLVDPAQTFIPANGLVRTAPHVAGER